MFAVNLCLEHVRYIEQRHVLPVNTCYDDIADDKIITAVSETWCGDARQLSRDSCTERAWTNRQTAPSFLPVPRGSRVSMFS